jgi:recombination protein RecR
MHAIHKLSEFFKDFPGIGPRQAKRFVYYLLSRDEAYLNELSRLIKEIRRTMNRCESCFKYFEIGRVPSATCAYCSNLERDRSILTVISKDIDLEAIEKSGSYNGMYFVLGGSLPILEKDPDSKIRSRELFTGVKNSHSAESTTPIKEIIIALNLNPEGDNTADYIIGKLRPLTDEYSIKISTLGRGLSTGSEIEYADGDTIKNAFKNRF